MAFFQLRARVLLALRDRRKTRAPPPVNPPSTYFDFKIGAGLEVYLGNLRTIKITPPQFY